MSCPQAHAPKPDPEKLNALLLRHAECTDPLERRKLLRSWLDAGGRQAVKDAVTAGLQSAQRSEDI